VGYFFLWTNNKNSCSTFCNKIIIRATILVEISKGYVKRYELELLLMAISISLLLTGLGRIYIEWDALKREIFPKGKAIIQKQKEAIHRV
jgi:hypothetical protein